MSAAAADQPRTFSAPATHVTHGWLTASAYRVLELEATARRLHPDTLTAKILEAVLWGDQVGLLLDR